MSKGELSLHDVVALLEDMPEHGLRRGQLGTVIDVYEMGVYEVEFADRQGQTYASLTLKGPQLMPLYDEPAPVGR
jgi:hypothetical protein